jgi:hypothetical protein
MCTCLKVVLKLLDDARNSTLPLDTALFIVFFIPGISAGILSLGSGILVRAYVDCRDRKHAEMLASRVAQQSVKETHKKSAKKHRPR